MLYVVQKEEFAIDKKLIFEYNNIDGKAPSVDCHLNPRVKPDEWAGRLADNEKSNHKKGALNCGEAVSLFKLQRGHFMDKRKSLDIIIKCAKQFEHNLNNQNVLFVALEKDGRCSFIESVFKARIFLHLTGVDIPLSSREFYRSCIDNTLSVQHLNYKNNFTELKLQVLSDAMSIDKTTKMIGDYNEG